MQVSEIMHADVKTVSAEDTFARAAVVLKEHRISSVVVRAEGRLAGIVTERDVVNMVADGLDPFTTTVGARMTKALVTVEPSTDVADAARIMGERRIRHLPVVEGDELMGMVSIRDFLPWASKQPTAGGDVWIDLMEAAVEWPH